MNERILELADKAIEDMPGAWNIPDEFCKKFAELIVRECAQLARDTDLEDVEGGDSDVLRAAKQQILEHFGVEE
jgi:hypothetical protein